MGRRKKNKKIVVKKKKKRHYPAPATPSQEETTEHTPLENWFLRQFWPEFEELPVGLMSFSLILMTIFDATFRNAVASIYNLDKAWFYVLMTMLIIFMICHSLYHVFSNTGKTASDKNLLVFLAAVCCIATGLFGGFRLMQIDAALIQIFGLFNLIQGIILAILFRLEYLDENSFSDRDTPFWGATVNFFIVFTMFSILKFTLNLHWIDYFSILVAYAMNFSSPVCDMLYDQRLGLFAIRTEEKLIE